MSYSDIGDAYESWIETHENRFLNQEKLINEGKDAGPLYCSRTKDGRLVIHDTFNAYCHRYSAYLNDKNPAKQPGPMYCNYRTQFDDKMKPCEYTQITESSDGSYVEREPVGEE